MGSSQFLLVPPGSSRFLPVPPSSSHQKILVPPSSSQFQLVPPKFGVRGGRTQLFLMQSHNISEIGQMSVKVVLLLLEKKWVPPPLTPCFMTFR